MSWDIFAQNIPPQIGSVAEMPEDYVPTPIAPRSVILEAVLAAAPFADASDPTWVKVDSPGASLEINIGGEEPLIGFAFHVRGGDMAAGLIADILKRLNLRAFDPLSETGIFDPANADESLARSRQFRDSVLAR